MENPNHKTDEQKLAEKAITDHKNFTKEEVKTIKSKTKEIAKVENGNPLCFVCGLPILKGQSVKELPKDEKHDYRRPYHGATCGVGSKAWAKMSGSKASTKFADKVAAKKEAKKAAKKEMEKVNKPAKKETKSEKPKQTKKSGNGQPREGTISANIIKVLKDHPKGLIMSEIVKALHAKDTYFTLCRTLSKRGLIVRVKKTGEDTIFKSA